MNFRPLLGPEQGIRYYCLIGANLERADLRNKDLRWVNFTGANLRGADLSGSNCTEAIFAGADLSRSNLHGANFTQADFSMADMSMSYMKACDFTDARMWHSILRNVFAKNALFFRTDLRGSDFRGAEMLGAKFDGADTRGLRNIHMATFRWFWNPLGGKPSYEPFPGANVLFESAFGGISVQENAGKLRAKQRIW